MQYWISRNPDGSVASAARTPFAGASEVVDEGHPDLVAFLAPKPATVADVKAEARRRILARYADWKQDNMTARGVELLKLRIANGAWTAAEQAEADALKAAWDWIKAVRAASDAIEADLGTMTVEAMRADARWPT